MNKIGSNQHKTKYKYPLGLTKFAWFALLKVLFFGWLLLATMQAVRYYVKLYRYERQSEYISPCPDSGCHSFQYNPIVVYAAEEDMPIDYWVDKYSDKYGQTKWLKLRTKTLLHYLLLRESAYGATEKCGDNGKACGPLQFWEDTYKANRKRMMMLGHVDHMGSRLDTEDAIETTAYMISIGQEKQWGPVLRSEIKL